MLPFLELPVCLANTEKEEKVVMGRMKPGDISYMYPGFYSGTVIVFKSGSSMLTTASQEEIDAALIAYKDFIDKFPGKFGNLQLNSKPKSKLHVTD